MTRLWPLLVALMLFPRLGWAEDEDTDLDRAHALIADVEIPLAGTVELFDCSGKWRSDTFCKLVWAADIRMWDKRDYLGALEFAVAALKLKRRSRRGLGMIGSALMRLGDCPRALPYLQVSAHLDERLIAVDDYVHCLTYHYTDRIDLFRAVRLAELAAHKSGSAWNWYAAARLHARIGNYEAARNRTERIVTDHPDDDAANSQYAAMLEQLGEVDLAVEAARRALALRQKMRGEAAERAASVEAYWISLIDTLITAEQYDEARNHARALLRAPEEKQRKQAGAMLIKAERLQFGPERALELVAEIEEDVEVSESTRAKLEFLAAMANEGEGGELNEKWVFYDQVAWLIATGAQERAAEVVAERIRKREISRELLSTLDFRERECSVLATARYSYIRSRSDYADLWRDALFRAAWVMVCGRTPGTNFNASSEKSEELQARARAMFEAASLFAVGDYDDAFRAAAELPADLPPIAHVFGMWVAAGVTDHAAFERHAAAAARGGRSADEHMAHIFYWLRRGDPATARTKWKALPAWVRDQPIVLDTPQALLGYMIIKEAHEVAPDFAVEMAEKWFWTDGPLERWVWQRLRRTGTKVATK